MTHPPHHPPAGERQPGERQPGQPVLLAPDEGQHIAGVDARLLVALEHPAYASTFVMTIAPGFDVGAHRHHDAAEMFFILDGELDLLCLEPLDASPGDWHQWRSATGHTYLHGGPGAFMYVPPDTAHAFANRADTAARILFQSTVRGGHENYFTEMAAILAAHAIPDPQAIADLRVKYDTEQLTVMRRRPPAAEPAGGSVATQER